MIDMIKGKNNIFHYFLYKAFKNKKQIKYNNIFIINNKNVLLNPIPIFPSLPSCRLRHNLIFVLLQNLSNQTYNESPTKLIRPSG